MHHHPARAAVARLLLALILAALCALPVAAEPPPDEPILLENPQFVQFLATHEENPPRIAAPDLPTGPQLQANSFVIDFMWEGYVNAAGDVCHAWPAQAQAAANYAAAIWSSIISSPVPIHIQACWTDLPSGVLGYSGAYHLVANSYSVPHRDTWYPVALASAIESSDLNDGYPEMLVALSRSAPWYLGTNAQTPRGAYDLTTVMLHEIAHGIGFSGSMTVYNGLGYWGYQASSGAILPTVYDLFAENAAGQRLITVPDGSTALAGYLTGGAVYYNGHNTVIAAGGRARLYAPYPWREGSSYSHLDQVTYQGGAHSLMTPMLSDGAAYHHPGTIALSMLRDIGWLSMVRLRLVDLRLRMDLASPANPQPGDTVTYTLTVSNLGPDSALQVVVRNTLPPNMAAQGWSASPTAYPPVLRAGSGYVWDMQSLGPGQQCTITVVATIASPLSANWVAFDVASAVSQGTELTPANNMDLLIFGDGLPLHVPVVAH